MDGTPQVDEVLKLVEAVVEIRHPSQSTAQQLEHVVEMHMPVHVLQFRHHQPEGMVRDGGKVLYEFLRALCAFMQEGNLLFHALKAFEYTFFVGHFFLRPTSS